MSARPRLLPVAAAVATFPVLDVAAHLWMPRRLGPGPMGADLVFEFALMIATLSIVAVAGWWRQTGLVGPWREPWWALLPAALLAMNLLVSLPSTLRQGDGALLPSVLALVPMVGICEETLTRGVMLYGLSRYGPLVAGLASSVIFGALHASNFFAGLPPSYVGTQMVTAALFGLLMAGVRLRMISIWPGIWIHAMFDVPGLLKGYLVPPLDPFQAVVSIGIMLPFGMAGLGLLLWDQLDGWNFATVAGRLFHARAAPAVQ